MGEAERIVGDLVREVVELSERTRALVTEGCEDPEAVAALQRANDGIRRTLEALARQWQPAAPLPSSPSRAADGSTVASSDGGGSWLLDESGA